MGGENMMKGGGGKRGRMNEFGGEIGVYDEMGRDI